MSKSISSNLLNTYGTLTAIASRLLPLNLNTWPTSAIPLTQHSSGNAGLSTLLGDVVLAVGLFESTAWGCGNDKHHQSIRQ
jgi:hypothetical protein